MTQFENITKYLLNDEQVLYDSSLLTQLSTKMIEQHAENNVRWSVINYCKLLFNFLKDPPYLI